MDRNTQVRDREARKVWRENVREEEKRQRRIEEEIRNVRLQREALLTERMNTMGDRQRQLQATERDFQDREQTHSHTGESKERISLQNPSGGADDLASQYTGGNVFATDGYDNFKTELSRLEEKAKRSKELIDSLRIGEGRTGAFGSGQEPPSFLWDEDGRHQESIQMEQSDR